MDFPFTYREWLEDHCINERDGVAHIVRDPCDNPDEADWIVDGVSLYGIKDGSWQLLELPSGHYMWRRLRLWVLGNHYRDIDHAWAQQALEVVS